VNLDKNQNAKTDQNKTCPVTHLPMMQRPEWVYENPDSDYRVEISVFGNRIVLSQPSGYAQKKDIKVAMSLLDLAVREAIPVDKTYIAIKDYSLLKGASPASRKYLIDYVKRQKRLSAVIFCGISPLSNLSIRLARYMYRFDTTVRIEKDCTEGLRAAKKMLQKGPLQPAQSDLGSQEIPISTTIETRPEWHLQMEGFSVQYGVIGGRVIHGVSKGYLEKHHIEPLIEMMKTVYAGMGSPQDYCYCINGVKDVMGSTRKARVSYYRAMRTWFLEHPEFRIYIFCNPSRLLHAAIRITSALAPFTTFTTKSVEAALEIINDDYKKAKKGALEPVAQHNTPAKGYPPQKYVDELLHYLGDIDWADPETGGSRAADPSHPFLQVFDGIDLIKSELGALLKERDAAELSLNREKLLSESIIENIPAGIAFLDRNFILRKYNRFYARYLEKYAPYPPEKCLGMFYADYVPGGWDQVEKWYTGVRDTGRAESRRDFKLTVDMDGARIDTFWDRSVAPVFDPAGKVEGILVMTTDTTERKRGAQESERLKNQLRQAQKMESIGTLAGGIAHDFNNILAAILGFTELSLLGAKEGTKLRRNLEGVFQAGKRARNLVKQILEFSRQTNPEMKLFQIKPVVDETLRLMRASLPAIIEIKAEVKSDANLMGDSTQIHQVLVNLCTNAGHAIGDGAGILTVTVTDIELGTDFAKTHLGIVPGEFIKMSVTDTGEGIELELLERIFDPYFTTKEKGRGTGMGLAVVHGIVKNHGGTITVESEPGSGATFTVFLPKIRHVAPLDVESENDLPRGDEHILFVDDEEDLADMGKQILESLGYQVSARASSVEALELFKTRSDSFDLVITDMSMPNMNGADLARKILGIRPGIPIILCSGLGERIAEVEAQALGVSAFVAKPILNADLAKIVRKMLDSDNAG
jgi:signal transduction histidine kinase/CheY-like chemotaxis protein